MPRRLLLGATVAAVLALAGDGDAAETSVMAFRRLAEAVSASGSPAGGSLAGGSPAAGGAGPAGERVLNIVAHPDDDLLFLSPDLLLAVTRAARVRTVYLTAGDAGLPARHWQAREQGVRAAYAFMAQARDDWQPAQLGVKGVAAQALSGRPGISVAFLRLPDGGVQVPRSGVGSLTQLAAGGAIESLDGTARYTQQSLVATVAALIADFGPTRIATIDPQATEEHADHRATAVLVSRAAAAAPTPVSGGPCPVTRYLGYAGRDLPENLTGPALLLKRMAFQRYAAHDERVCLDRISCPGGRYHRWLARQYRAVPGRAL